MKSRLLHRPEQKEGGLLASPDWTGPAASRLGSRGGVGAVWLHVVDRARQHMAGDMGGVGGADGPELANEEEASSCCSTNLLMGPLPPGVRGGLGLLAFCRCSCRGTLPGPNATLACWGAAPCRCIRIIPCHLHVCLLVSSPSSPLAIGSQPRGVVVRGGAARARQQQQQ